MPETKGFPASQGQGAVPTVMKPIRVLVYSDWQASTSQRGVRRGSSASPESWSLLSRSGPEPAPQGQTKADGCGNRSLPGYEHQDDGIEQSSRIK